MYKIVKPSQQSQPQMKSQKTLLPYSYTKPTDLFGTQSYYSLKDLDTVKTKPDEEDALKSKHEEEDVYGFEHPVTQPQASQVATPKPSRNVSSTQHRRKSRSSRLSTLV